MPWERFYNIPYLQALQENVEFMAEYMDLRAFKAIYVVDLCGALCKQVQTWHERLHLLSGH